MTTQTPTHTRTIEWLYRMVECYRDIARRDLARAQAPGDALHRDIEAASATNSAMIAGAYRREADRLPLPPESDGPAYVQACAQLADIRIWAEEAGKLAGLALETAAQVQA